MPSLSRVSRITRGSQCHARWSLHHQVLAVPTWIIVASPRPSDCSTRAGGLDALGASIRRPIGAATQAE